MQLKHYPDKPWEQKPEFLAGWDQSGKYACEQKIDGWRMMIIITEKGLEFISRHNKNHTRDIEPELKKAAQELLEHFPVQTQIDAEWLSRRSCNKEYKLTPRIFLLDVMRYGSEWLLSKTYDERHKLIEDVMPKIRDRVHIDTPPTATAGTFVSFYEDQKKVPYSEGVVIKHRDSKLVGNRNECAKNTLWFKVKYRGGSDGEMSMTHLRGKHAD